MHAYLIAGIDSEQIEVKIKQLIKTLKAKKVDFELQKIADMKNLSGFTKLLLTERVVVVVKDIDEASEETQNAFLKSLEEPQRNLSYILTATNIARCLPTIVSRCQLIEVPCSGHQVVDSNFIDLPVGKMMEIISNIKNREEAVEFITNLIYKAHSDLIRGENLGSFLENANKTLGALKANGNVQLQLTNFVVNLNR